jgi:hypothetical protein
MVCNTREEVFRFPPTGGNVISALLFSEDSDLTHLPVE